jgi:anti-anti-sigma regulatory factor
MHIEVGQGTLSVRVGDRFGVREAERLGEVAAAFTPISELTVDFSAVRDFQDAALPVLATTAHQLRQAKVAFRGLTQHHWRMLTYLEVASEQEAAVS